MTDCLSPECKTCYWGKRAWDLLFLWVGSTSLNSWECVGGQAGSAEVGTVVRLFGCHFLLEGGDAKCLVGRWPPFPRGGPHMLLILLQFILWCRGFSLARELPFFSQQPFYGSQGAGSCSRSLPLSRLIIDVKDQDFAAPPCNSSGPCRSACVCEGVGVVGGVTVSSHRDTLLCSWIFFFFLQCSLRWRP